MTETHKKTGEAAVAWWRRLHTRQDGTGGHRAAVAQLKRASTPLEAMLVPEAIHLHRSICEALGRDALNRSEADGVAVVAAVLARVKPGAPVRTSLAAMLGQTSDGRRPGPDGQALLSASRFAALVRADDPGERLRNLRRGIQLAGGRQFDAARFAADQLWWDGDCRRRWVFEYYQEGRSAEADVDFEGENAL